MKAIDLLKLFREPYNLFVANGIHPDDIRLIDMYDDYVRMHDDGEKTTYIVSVLAGKYNISERSVYNAISRLGRDCKQTAVGFYMNKAN